MVLYNSTLGKVWYYKAAVSETHGNWEIYKIQLEACYGSGLRGTTLNKNERVSLICVCQAYLA